MRKLIYLLIPFILLFTAACDMGVESPYLEIIQEQIEEDVRISEDQDSMLSVIYNGNGHTGGEVPVDDAEYEEGDEAVVLGNINGLEKTGNSFSGWSQDVKGTGDLYESGDIITLGSNDITLYAQWIKNDISIGITNPESPDISISPQTFTIELGGGTTTQTVVVQPGEGINLSSYEWFVNSVSRGTWSSIILDTAAHPEWFELGVNSLMLFVEIDGTVYSEIMYFHVEQQL